jgi:hypothetical protein
MGEEDRRVWSCGLFYPLAIPLSPVFVSPDARLSVISRALVKNFTAVIEQVNGHLDIQAMHTCYIRYNLSANLPHSLT